GGIRTLDGVVRTGIRDGRLVRWRCRRERNAEVFLIASVALAETPGLGQRALDRVEERHGCRAPGGFYDESDVRNQDNLVVQMHVDRVVTAAMPCGAGFGTVELHLELLGAAGATDSRSRAP